MDKKDFKKKALEVFNRDDIDDLMFEKILKDIRENPIKLEDISLSGIFFIKEDVYKSMLASERLIQDEILFVSEDESIDTTNKIEGILYKEGYVEVKIESFDEISDVINEFDYCFEKEIDSIDSIYKVRKGVKAVLRDNNIVILPYGEKYYTIEAV